MDIVKKPRWNDIHSYSKGPGRHVFRMTVIDERPDETVMPLSSLIALLEKAKQSVPVGYRENMLVKLASDGFDGEYADLSVWVERSENDEEYAARMEKESEESRKAAAAQAARERGMYEALKKKFETTAQETPIDATKE